MKSISYRSLNDCCSNTQLIVLQKQKLALEMKMGLLAERATEYFKALTHACELCMHQNGDNVLSYTK